MAKVKRSGRWPIGGKPKGRAKPRRATPPASTESAEPAESMTVVASVTRTVTMVSAGPSSAGAMPVAFAAESVTAEAFVAPASFAAGDGFLGVSMAANDLFDVVCSVHKVLASNLDLGVAQVMAQEHNDATGHDAQPRR